MSEQDFDQWYSQAFEGTKVASFDPLEALSIEHKVQDLAKTRLSGSGDHTPHTYNPETVYPQVWAVLGFAASLDTRSPSPALVNKDKAEEHLALTEALTDRCQRIVVRRIILLPACLVFVFRYERFVWMN